MIFGREPAAIVAVIKAILYFVASFWAALDEALIAAILAAVTAILDLAVAYLTSQTTFGVVLAVFNTGLVLVVTLGLPWNEDQQAMFLAVAAAVVGFFVQRTQVSPLSRGTWANSPTP